ncbi:AraC family transcriptional regulator [Plantibacter sp. VKM Ac-2876]|uniref:AraC family transcriptional regulator n=1 Tax=Plantibacter sp. VKM Ac-2876 TaxID=2783826 RepID=UPI001889D00E|nr:AraC family transcriptional regulator [Plantibacter sp. VKM Ac-2876]
MTTRRFEGTTGMQEASGALRFVDVDPERFSMTVDSVVLGEYVLHRNTVGPGTFDVLADAYGLDEPVATIVMLIEGAASLVHGRQQLDLLPGSGTLTEGAKTYRTTIHDHATYLYVFVPMRALRRLGIAPTSALGPLAPSPLLRGSAAFLVEVISAFEPIGGAAQLRLCRVIDTMLATLYAENDLFRAEGEAGRVPLRLRIIEHIAASFAERELRPETLARRFNMSTRSLQRVFEGSGTSAAGEIAERRVQLALALLSDPDHRGLSIAEVAARCGYHSQAHLRRAVVAHTGLSPSQFREQTKVEDA